MFFRNGGGYMLYFESDYNNGAHNEVLKRLIETNDELLSGYGADKYCESAKEKIKRACGRDDAQVFLTVGGTQTNKIVISSLLKSYEGVISADTGHITGHEAGAIENAGHKVLTIRNSDGKIKAETLKKYMTDFYAERGYEHSVFPGMVYISHPTEYGTLYSYDELERLSAVCKEYDLPLYLDGARLGYALVSGGTDVTLEDIANLCDVFYIGGTKVGALCGEAVVFTHGNAPKQFFTLIKQNGALLAKGRVLGVQFDALFTDDLYFKISRHAIEKADKMRKAFSEKGYKIFIETVTNQIFVVMENAEVNELSRSVVFNTWGKYDENHTVVRFVSSWATKDEDVERLIKLL